MFRGRKNKQVAFLIEESLKERAGGAAEVKAKLSHFFTPISCDSGHSGSIHRMELCVSLCNPSSAVLPYGALTLMTHESVEHEGLFTWIPSYPKGQSMCDVHTVIAFHSVCLFTYLKPTVHQLTPVEKLVLTGNTFHPLSLCYLQMYSCMTH